MPRITRSLIGDVVDRHAARHRAGPADDRATPRRRARHRGRGRPRPLEGTRRRDPGVREGRRHAQVDRRGGQRDSPRSPRAPTSSIDFLTHLEDDRHRRLRTRPTASTASSRPTRTTSSPPSPTSAKSRRSSTRTLDPQTQEALKTGIDQFATASARLNDGPGQRRAVPQGPRRARSTRIPETDFGQTRAAAQPDHLRPQPADPDPPTARRPLNTQRQPSEAPAPARDLYDNMNRMAISGNEAFDGFKPILATSASSPRRSRDDPSVHRRGRCRGDACDPGAGDVLDDGSSAIARASCVSGGSSACCVGDLPSHGTARGGCLCWSGDSPFALGLAHGARGRRWGRR